MPSPPYFLPSSLLLIAALALGPAPARALGLGALPRLPPPVDELARPALRQVDDTLATSSSQIRALLREHPRALARDPAGALVLRGELLAIDVDARALARAVDAGFRVRSQQRLAPLELSIVVLEVPPRRSLRRALRQLRELDPDGRYDYNHVYLGGGGSVAGPPMPAPAPAGPGAGVHARVGLVDGGVDPLAPGIDGHRLRRSGCPQAPPDPHGTAVAALLLADARVQVHAADIYCGEATGGAVSRLADALAWLAGERATVVNMSLVGPPNLLLQAVVEGMQARGHVLVAAVGNDGPAAPPRFPAAYPGVIGVAGLDERGRPLPESGRGAHVDASAPGLFVMPGDPPRHWRGSSFAAPRVTRRVALAAGDPGPQALPRVEQALLRQLEDAGKHGRDSRYGLGRLPPDPAVGDAD